MKHLGTKTLETTRLILRKTKDSDAEPMFRNWANDARVTKFMTWYPYESAQQLRDTYHQYLLDNQKRNDFYDWKIELKEIGEPIGSISVVGMDEAIEEVKIGYCIGYNWWHQGIMTEAFTEVIRYLFEEVGVNRIVAAHDVNNPHSGDVMKKCGLQFEGIRREGGKNNQGMVDLATYAILRESFSP